MSGKGKRQLISLDPPKVAQRPLENLAVPNPLFYIGGNNGAKLIRAYCMKKGWMPTNDKTRKDYKLKWCSIKSRSNYWSFQEGKQLLYQIPNNWIFTTKIGLLRCLRDYERELSSIWNPRRLKMADFYPETYRLDIPSERTSFFSHYVDSQTWICKPTGLNQGRGIFLLQNSRQVKDLRCQLKLSKDDPNHVSEASIVQRYIPNPLLLGGRKFDVRCYMIIASTVPYVVFFRHGYVRLTCDRYNPNSTDLTGHLTNQYMQKRHPRFKELKEETIWSMQRFNSYVNEVYASKKGLPKHWVLNIFTKKMQQIMAHCFASVKSQLTCRRGYFDLIGCDFLIDEDFKVWLLEMNCNPSLSTSCKVQKEVIPEVIKDTLDLTLEIFDKEAEEPILPLKTKNQCVLLYNGQINQDTVAFRQPNSLKVQKEPLRNVKKLPPTVKSPGRQKPVPKSPAILPGVGNMRNTSWQSSYAGRLSKVKTLTALPDIKNTRDSSLLTFSAERPSTSGYKAPSTLQSSSLSTPAPRSAELRSSKKIPTVVPDIKHTRSSSLRIASVVRPSTAGSKAPSNLKGSSFSTPAPTSAEARSSKKISTAVPDIKHTRSSSLRIASLSRPWISGCNASNIFRRDTLSTLAPTSADVRPLTKVPTGLPDLKNTRKLSLPTAPVERPSTSGTNAPSVSTPAPTSADGRPSKKMSSAVPDKKF